MLQSSENKAFKIISTSEDPFSQSFTMISKSNDIRLQPIINNTEPGNHPLPSFTILPKSPEDLPKSFTVLSKSEENNDLFDHSSAISDQSDDNMHIKEAHQSFAVLGKTKMTTDPTEDDIVEVSSIASSNDTVGLSYGSFEDDNKMLRRPTRLIPINRHLNEGLRDSSILYNRNNWFGGPASHQFMVIITRLIY